MRGNRGIHYFVVVLGICESQSVWSCHAQLKCARIA